MNIQADNIGQIKVPIADPEAPPEGRDYDVHPQDRGCKVHPSCLTCPLPQCIYDGGEVLGQVHFLKRLSDHLAREETVNRHIAQGLPFERALDRAARVHGVGPRSIRRSVKKARKWRQNEQCQELSAETLLAELGQD